MIVAADEREGARLTLGIPPAVAQRLGVADGDLVEIPRDDAPSLLAWARIAADVPQDRCAILASTAALLGLIADDPVSLRRVQDRRR